MPNFKNMGEVVVNYGWQLGYHLPEYICYGFATSCLELLMAGDKKTLFRLLGAIQTGKLNAQDLQISAFYEKIFLYQQPEKFDYLFNAYVSQIHLSAISFFAASAKMEKMGSLLPVKSVTNVYTLKELESYIDVLAHIFFFNHKKASQHKKMGFILSSKVHSIGLYFDHTAKHPRWIFINTEDDALKFFNLHQTAELAKKIFESFVTGSNRLCCNTTLIVPGNIQNKSLSKQLEKLDQINVDRLQDKVYSRKITKALTFLSCYLNDTTVYKIAHERILNSKQLYRNDNETSVYKRAYEKMLRSRELYRNDLLYLAILNGDEEAFIEALDNQANLNGFSRMEGPPLIWAGINKHSRFVKILLERGSDVNQRDAWGNTLLHILCRYGNFSMTKYVIEHYAPDLNVLNLEQMSPFLIAVSKGDEKIVNLFLMQKGLDTSAHFWLDAQILPTSQRFKDAFVQSLNPAAHERFKHWERSSKLFEKKPCLSPYEVARINGHDKMATAILKYTNQKNKLLSFFPQQMLSMAKSISHRRLPLQP